MTGPMKDDDRVLIAGAGPVGMACAGLLHRAGIPVTVLEMEAAPPLDLRAGTFHPPSLEVLAPTGLTDRLLAMGIQVPVWQYRDLHEGVIDEFDLGILKNDTPYPYRLHCEQHKLTRAAYEVLGERDGIELLFSHKLVAIDQDADSVTATAETPDGQRRFSARWLIGADGGRSTVRSLLRFDFPGFTWPELFVVVSTTYDFGQHGFSPNAYIADPVDWCAVFQMPHSGGTMLWRFAYGDDPDKPDEALLGDAVVEERMQRFVARSEPYRIDYRSTYRVHQRVCDTFRHGRVLLAGDAAHINNPIGGLGMNSGIQDAGNLCEKLIHVWRGEADEALLDRYVRQRRTAAVDSVQEMSIRNKSRLQETDPEQRRRARDEMRRIAADPARHREFLLRTSMIESVRKAASIE